MNKKWHNLPANAKTITTIESAIDFLKQHHPYPPNMKPDRKHFAVARLGYEAAIYQLEKYQCILTEEVELALLEDKQLEG